MGIKDLYHNAVDCFRPVLSDRVISQYNKKNLLIVQHLSKSQIQPNSVDLTLGDTWKTILPNKYVCKCDQHVGVIDPKEPIKYNEGRFFDGNPKWYCIEPKSFVLMASREILNIPNGILSFVQGRSSIARLAIQTEQAGLIDAGFRGTITFEVFNQSDYPIYLYEGMRIAQVYFFRAQYAKQIYGAENKGSKYYDQIEATGSKINMDVELHK